MSNFGPRICWPLTVNPSLDNFSVTFPPGGGPSENILPFADPVAYDTPELLLARICAVMNAPADLPSIGITMAMQDENGDPYDPVTPNGHYPVATDERGRIVLLFSGGDPGDAVTFDLGAGVASLVEIIGGTVSDSALFDADGIARLVCSYQYPNLWVPEQLPAKDSRPNDVAARTLHSTSSKTKVLDFGSIYTRKVKFTLLPTHKVWQAREGSTHPNESFQQFFRSDGIANFIYSPDVTRPWEDLEIVGGAATSWCLTETSMQQFAPTQPHDGLQRFDFEIEMRTVSNT